MGQRRQIKNIFRFRVGEHNNQNNLRQDGDLCPLLFRTSDSLRRKQLQEEDDGVEVKLRSSSIDIKFLHNLIVRIFGKVFRASSNENSFSVVYQPFY